ncbi:MAG: MBL fold metallo-hydrolase [Desulfitobacteriaceae bacterium]
MPQNPLKSLNSYVVKAGKRNLIVDTGFNREECMSAMHLGLKEIGVDLRETDFLLTHVHADHAGSVANLATNTSVIYCTKVEGETFNSKDPWKHMRYFIQSSGISENDIRKAVELFPIAESHLNFRFLKEGDTLNYADYLFRCVETPGHTKGHMCLYEAEKKILISGDHILGEITPNISAWSYVEDPLAEYFNSLDKVYGLDIKLVLPGHRSIITDCKTRIQQLRLHHQTRLAETVAILEKGSQNAFEVAAQMTWDMTYKSWELFPLEQKLFTYGEALAHLAYLEGKGKIRKDLIDQKMVFTLK